MNIALFAQSVIFRTIQAWVHALKAGRTRTFRTETRVAQVRHPDAPLSIATNSQYSGANGSMPAVVRPLRVVRVMEAGQDRCGVGRMVISGRMADVCAELDRLAAREAACS